MKILVIGAHPDDEVLGVGGTICKHVSDGDDVYVCIVTKAYEPQWSKEYIEKKIQEQKQVDNLLNIKKRFNLDFPTVKLNTLPHGELNKMVTNVVRDVNPDVVYTHFEGDLNYDHSLIYRSTLVATRPPNKIKLFSYEVLSETEWGIKLLKPNIWVDIKEFLNKKIEVFQKYKSEIKDFPHPRSIEGIKVLATKRGMEVCLEYAEAFKLIREIL